jgi:DNA polymerase/3'-5' exonuclease PolX
MAVTEKTRIPWAEAHALGMEGVELLRPVCERIELAGSIRRKAETCGDIEVVCVPKVVRHEDSGETLFGDDPWEENLLDAEVSGRLLTLPWAARLDVNGHRAMGSKYKRLTYRGFALDLFAVIEPAQWGVIFTIRTGPADYSHRLVTSTYAGGLLPPWFRVKHGALWGGSVFLEVVPTPEEEDFYREIEQPWIAPEARR